MRRFGVRAVRTPAFAGVLLAGLAAGPANAQGTSIAGLLATGYELKGVVAIPGGCGGGRACEALYFEGRPGQQMGAKQIYRCVVSAPRSGAETADAVCAQVR